MKYILFITLLFCLRGEGQTIVKDTPSIYDMGGIRCLVAHYTEDGVFQCDFKGHYYPDYINDSTVFDWFVYVKGGDSIFSHRTDSIHLYIWDKKVPKNGDYGYQSEMMHNTGYGITMPGKYTTDTIKFKRQEWREYKKPVCPHIFVAVLSDTVVWDKTPRYPPPGNGFSYDDGVISWINPQPTTQRIVCVLCHKVTEQSIKVVGENVVTLVGTSAVFDKDFGTDSIGFAELGDAPNNDAVYYRRPYTNKLKAAKSTEIDMPKAHDLVFRCTFVDSIRTSPFVRIGTAPYDKQYQWDRLPLFTDYLIKK